jgi:hypothetical protein
MKQRDGDFVVIGPLLQLRHPQFFVAQCVLLNPLMYKYNSFVSQIYYMEYIYDK